VATETSRQRVHSRVSPRRVGLSVLCIVLSLVVVGPLLWIFSLSLKTSPEAIGNQLLPASPQFGNFTQAWTEYDLGTFFLNSIVITGVSVVATLFVSILAAYSFTRLKFRGSEWLFGFLLLGVIIPPAALAIPLLIEFRQLNLINSHVGLMLAYVAFGIPVSTLILRGFFERLPTDLIDAARLDGCSEWTIVWRVIVPLSKSAITTVLVLLFLINWNEFIIALVLLSETHLFTLPVGLSTQVGQYTSSYNLIAAAALIASFPVFVLYLVLQGQFERGVTEGALKG
jgi:raffinose/stachyose/melibiose transport system permease protein